MKSTITREESVQAVFDLKVGYRLGFADIEILKRVARMALAAMDSEPVIIVGDDSGDALSYRRLLQSFAPGTKLYRHAQPAPERDQVRSEHAEWSQTTFGNVGPVGPLKHLSKEALEAAAEPGDLSEWADMQFLLWDAQRRAGITDEQITQAMIEKLAVNKQREWPEPKDGEPRLHIKAQPAQVTEREPIAWLNDAYLARGVVDGEAGSEDAGPGYIPVYREAQPAPVVPEEMTPQQASRSYGGEVRGYRDGWNACRAAMLQAQSGDDGEPTDDERIMAIEGIHNCERCGDERWVVGEMGITRCACGQAGNSPVIGIDPASGTDRTVEVRYVAPPGYVMVPKEPTAEMQSAGASAIRIETTALNKLWTGNAVFRAMLAAAPQEAK